MGLRIASNIASLNVNRSHTSISEQHGRTLDRLSSGQRIVRAADDASGLSISEKLKAGIRSNQMASRNTVDGISMVQTAEGGITEAQNILVRLRELSVQAASDTLGAYERSLTNQEFTALRNQIGNIANTTVFNGKYLLNGTGTGLDIQVGVENHDVDRFVYSPGDTNITPAALGLAGMHVETKDMAQQNLGLIDRAVTRINGYRARLGGVQAALSSNVNNLSATGENSSAANSRIRDADMAEWKSKETQLSITEQSGVAVMSQANNLGRAALKLIGGE